MRILITGGAGFIGSQLVSRLTRRSDVQITVLDNLHRGNREALHDCLPQIRFIEGDIRNREAVDAAMQGVQVVIHLAAQSNVIGATDDPEYCFSTNVMGTFHLLQAARRFGVERFVFASSREVYGDPASLPVPEDAPLSPKNAYGASKAAGEHYCRISNGQGLETMIVRLANVYGPGDRGRVIPIFVKNALNNIPLVVYGENKLVDFVWVGDVISMLLKCISVRAEGPVNICSGKGTELVSLARRVVELSGSNSHVVLRPSRSVEVDQFVGDTAKAESLLGLTPNSDPLYMLAECVSEFRPALA